MKSPIHLGNKSIYCCRDENEEITSRTTSFNLNWFNHAYQTKKEFQKDSKQAIVLSVAGDILFTISQCIYSLLLQPFSSDVHKNLGIFLHGKERWWYWHKSNTFNQYWLQSKLAQVYQWCDKDHPKTWSYQSHHTSVPSLTLSIIIDPAVENGGFFRDILFYPARLYMCIIAIHHDL